MTLYKLIKIATGADILRLNYPTHGECENYEMSIALHHLTWNEPYALTLDVTSISRFIEDGNDVIEVWTTYGELSYGHEGMLNKLGDNTKPTIEQALALMPCGGFVEDITLGQIDRAAELSGVSIKDVLNYVYLHGEAVELEAPIETEHDMDYRGFTKREREVVEKYLDEADAIAHWIDGKLFGDAGGRRYIVDFPSFGESETFDSVRALVETAEYCLEEWGKSDGKEEA